MSNDEIVSGLKARHPQGTPGLQDPAGEIELAEEDLDSVGGGIEVTLEAETVTNKECTDQATVCLGTCCVPFAGGCCGPRPPAE